MKKIILSLSFLAVLQTFAQTNEIYGITRNNNPNVTYLAKVNTTNGLVQDISNTSYSPFIANFSFTVDPNAGIYYYAGLDNFIGVDMNTGTLVHENPITTSELPIFQNFIYNEITQEIIGLERGGFNEGVYLSKIDPATGIVTPISTSSIANSFSVSGCAIDLSNQWFHLFSEDKILSVDVATGDVVHNPIVDRTEYENFNNLIYNAADGNLYAIGRNNNPNELFFVQINPITGVVTTISPTSLGDSLALEGSALDPFSGIYYFKRPNPTAIVGVDVNTGVEVSSTPFDFTDSNGAFFGYFYFGGQTQELILSNTDFSNASEITIYPSPTNQIVHINGSLISEISAYAITGQQIASWKFNNDENITLDVSSYKKGVYFLEVTNSKQQVITKKFIKE